MLAALACNSFGGDAPGTGDAGALSVTDAAGASDGGAIDAEGAPEASAEAGEQSWPGDPPSIGVACDARAPRPRMCHDFNGSVDVGTSKNGTLALEPATGDRHLAIKMKDNVTGDVAFYQDLSGLSRRVRWSFDLLVDSPLTNETELMEVLNEKKLCSVQFRRVNNRLVLADYCTSDAGVLELPLPSTKEWVSVLAAVDFSAKSFQVAMRTASGVVTRAGPAKLTQLMLGELSLGIGITYAPKAAPGPKLNLDNVTADWE